MDNFEFIFKMYELMITHPDHVKDNDVKKLITESVKKALEMATSEHKPTMGNPEEKQRRIPFPGRAESTKDEKDKTLATSKSGETTKKTDVDNAPAADGKDKAEQLEKERELVISHIKKLIGEKDFNNAKLSTEVELQGSPEDKDFNSLLEIVKREAPDLFKAKAVEEPAAGEVKDASTTQGNSASGMQIEQEKSDSPEKPVVNAETDISNKAAEEAEKEVIERAKTREEAHDRVKAMIAELVNKGIKENNTKERDKVYDFMIKAFPEGEDESDPTHRKKGRRKRNELIDVIWKECRIELKKREVETAKVAENQANSIIGAAENIVGSGADKPEEKKVDEPVETVLPGDNSDKFPPATTLGPNPEDKKKEVENVSQTNVPPGTLEVTPDMIHTALELAAESDPSTLTQEDIPTTDILDEAILRSFEKIADPSSIQEGGELYNKWYNHIKARTDKATEPIRAVKDVKSRDGKILHQNFDYTTFYLNRLVTTAKDNKSKAA